MSLNEEVPPESGCPTRDQLAAFSHSTLAPAALESVAEHLASCLGCAAVVREMDESVDGLLAELRRPARPEPFADEPACRQLEEAAQSFADGEGDLATVADGRRPIPQLAPFQLRQYRILEKLGQGGMGTVYKALHVRLNQVVAIKMIRPDRQSDFQVVARFHREMKTLGSLRHPNVIQVTDADEADGFDYLVMEYVEGIDLGRLVRCLGQLAVADACELARQAAVGLQHVHDQGLVHRDLKPSNFLVSCDGCVKVLDWGLALRSAAGGVSDDLTSPGLMMGTADFVAPEQVGDPHHVDGRADLYSLGCTLYCLLASRPPFYGARYPSNAKKIAAHVNEPVPPIQELRPDVHEELAALIGQLLAKDPAGRPACSAEVAERLAPFAKGSDLPGVVGAARALEEPPTASEKGQPGETNPPALETPHPPREAKPASSSGPSRRRLGPVAVAAAFLVGVGIAAGYLMRTNPPKEDETGPPIRGVWNPCLKREPVRLVLPDGPAGNALTSFDKGKELFVVDSGAPAYWSLGTADRANYAFRVNVKQHGWTEGMGIFFGYHETVRKGERCTKFQLIRLQNHGRLNREEPGGLFVHRELHYSFYQPASRLNFGMELMPIARLAPPPANEQEEIVEIQVGPPGLVHAFWGKQELTELLGYEANVMRKMAADCQLTEADYVGQFGLFVWSASVSFRNAQFMPNY
jgi:serine/threonine protein kinase